MTIPITPKTTHALPYSDEDEIAPTLIEQMAVAGRTAELQAALGAPIEVDLDTHKGTEALLRKVASQHDPTPLQDRAVALAAMQFLRAYGTSLAFDVATVRTAITNKLMEIADCGDRKHELRALELLGKHSDIGLFTERSEITIRHKTSTDLEKEITTRLQRLLHSDLVNVTPLAVGAVTDEDAWGETVVNTLDKILPIDHPGWEAPRRAKPPEGYDPYADMEEDPEEIPLDDFDDPGFDQ